MEEGEWDGGLLGEVEEVELGGGGEGGRWEVEVGVERRDVWVGGEVGDGVGGEG